MTGRKKVAAPEVDVLSQRFSQPAASDTPPTRVDTPPGLPVPKATARAAAVKKPTTRPAPAGMTRVTLYVTTEAAEALSVAAERVQGSGGRATKAEALSELLLAGVDQEAAVIEKLHRRLREELDA